MDAHGPDDRFFRHLVSSMRNGVIAIHRSGTLALMNDEAYRIFSLTRGVDDVGRPSAELFRQRPELVRALSGVFEMTTLPNRAELRLKDLDRVIGYTLSQVRDEDGTVIGAVVFFKDLTQVEQLEERERLRDRLDVLYPPATIQQATVDDGMFYRVRVGRISGEQAAQRFADDLKTKEGFHSMVIRLDDEAGGAN